MLAATRRGQWPGPKPRREIHQAYGHTMGISLVYIYNLYHLSIHPSIHPSIYLYIYVCVRVHVRVYTYVYTYVYAYMQICVYCIHACVCICVYTCVCVYIRIHIYIYVCVCVQCSMVPHDSVFRKVPGLEFQRKQDGS